MWTGRQVVVDGVDGGAGGCASDGVRGSGRRGGGRHGARYTAKGNNSLHRHSPAAVHPSQRAAAAPPSAHRPRRRREEPRLGDQVERQHREDGKHLGGVPRGVARAAVLDRLRIAGREARKPVRRLFCFVAWFVLFCWSWRRCLCEAGGGCGALQNAAMYAIETPASPPLRPAQDRAVQKKNQSPVRPQAPHEVHPLFEGALDRERLERGQHEVVPLALLFL